MSKRNIMGQLQEIGEMMNHAGFLSKVKLITASLTTIAEVIDGKHFDVDFDVVVKCQTKDFENIRNRFAKIDDMKIERIAENVLGINKGE